MSEDIMTALGQRFDRLEQLTLIGAKPVLDLEEAVMFTGLSRGHLYRLTSEKQIPYYKKCAESCISRNRSWRTGCLNAACLHRQKSRRRLSPETPSTA